MYFDDRIKGKQGLPWFDARSDWERGSDEYFEKLECLAEAVDDVESETDFITALSTDDFDNSYQYVLGRLRELRSYLKNEALQNADTDAQLRTLYDIFDKLCDLYSDAVLYDDETDDECDDECDDDGDSCLDDDDDDFGDADDDILL